MNQHERAPLLPISTDSLEFSKKAKFLGGILTILCSVGLSGNSFLIKLWQIDAVDFLLVRSLVSLVFFGGWTWRKKEKYFLEKSDYNCDKSYYKDVAILVLQAIVSELVITLTVVAVRLIPLSDALTFIWCQPLFVMLLSWICYGQSIRLYKSLVIVLLVTGIIFVVHPTCIFPTIQSSPNDG